MNQNRTFPWTLNSTQTHFIQTEPDVFQYWDKTDANKMTNTIILFILFNFYE